MNFSKHRTAAFIAAALILLGGAVVLLSPTMQPADPPAAEQTQAAEQGDAASELPAAPTTDYGGMLLKMIISVALVCLLAYAILRWGLSRVVGGNQAGEQMEVLGRLAVGPNRTILVVRVGPRYLVVGAGETGISKIAELSEQEAAGFLDPQVPEE